MAPSPPNLGEHEGRLRLLGLPSSLGPSRPSVYDEAGLLSVRYPGYRTLSKITSKGLGPISHVVISITDRA